MRPVKLYLEIFITFLLVMIVSETMIFFLFTDSERRIFGYKIWQDTFVKVRMLKKLVDEKGRWMPDIDIIGNYEIIGLLAQMEEIYDAHIFIADEDGTHVLRPSNFEIPEDIDLLNASNYIDSLDGIRFHNNVRKTSQVYTSIPLKTRANENLTLYIIFNVKIPPHHRWRFVLGLSLIGVVAAFLIIPVSKFITDRVKELKTSALRIADGELSHRVTVKTKDEIGELGIAFNQMAERLERMIIGGKELTANVSHELRTPLTRIRVAEEILTEHFEKGDFNNHQKYMDNIREDIVELDILIGRILELSKLDIHEAPLKRSSFSLSELIEGLLDRFGPIISHKELGISKELLARPLVSGDGESLHSAFLNILENATKYSPEKGSIRISMVLAGTSIVTSIINSSEALPEKDLVRIFEPFYRSRKTKAPGSGLGLSIASKIIERHGGRIEAFNSPEGLEIRVWLPVERQAKDNS